MNSPSRISSYRCVLVLCLLASAVPAGAKDPCASPDRILTSGPYTIRVREAAPKNGAGMVRVSRNGRVLVTLRERFIEEAKILPLLGPDSADLVVKTFSGGLHWSYVIYIVQLGPRLRPLLTFDARNYGTIDFRDLDHDGRQELIAWDDTFAYYDYSFAASPALPFVFRYEHGRYRDVTARFRWLVKENQEKAKRKLLKAKREYLAARRRAGKQEMSDKAYWDLESRDSLIHSAVVWVYGDGLLLGRSKQTERWLRANLPRQDWCWFRSRRRDIRRTLLARDRKLSYRLRKPPRYTPY